jgi:DNA-directed RNA polymerase subunit RPC12/RpoP
MRRLTTASRLPMELLGLRSLTGGGIEVALVACPDCQKQVSSEAPACPNCGRPLKAMPVQAMEGAGHGLGRACPYCGARAVGKVRGLQGGGEVLAGMVLFCLCVIPGVVYYVYMESIPYCSGCGRRVHAR